MGDSNNDLKGTDKKVGAVAKKESERAVGTRESGSQRGKTPERTVQPKASATRAERTHTEVYINWFLDRFRLQGEEEKSVVQTAFREEHNRGVSVFRRMYQAAIVLFNEELVEIRLAKKEMYVDKEVQAHVMGLNDKHLHALELNEQMFRLEEMLEEDKSGAVPMKDADKLGTEREIRGIRKQLGEWYGFNTPTETKHTFEGVDNIKFS